MRYRLSARADDDIVAIFVWGRDRFGEARATAYHEDLEQTFNLLADQPRMAPLRSGLPQCVRVHPHGAHVILYRIDPPDRITILRVRHASEDWQPA